MRIDSCRNCGFALSAKKHCSICSQPTQFKCDHCMKYAEDPIHANCQYQKPRVSMAQ